MDAAKLVESYLETWNETDPNARRSAVASVWAEDAQYVDPLADVSGHDEISGLIGAVQQQAPGHLFRLVDDRVDSTSQRRALLLGARARVRRRAARDRLRRRRRRGERAHP